MIILPTSYLPNIEYFSILHAEKKVIIEIYETYPKQTYRNRAEILSANGILNLSIPVKKVLGNKTKTGQIQIDHSEHWNLKHWRAIESAYNSSPFFIYYKDDIRKHFTGNLCEKLTDFNAKLTKTLCTICGIKCELVYSVTYTEKNTGKHSDYRDHFSPKASIKKDFPVYEQVFSNKYNFYNNLSIIDLLFNCGPETINYLNRIKNN